MSSPQYAQKKVTLYAYYVGSDYSPDFSSPYKTVIDCYWSPADAWMLQWKEDTGVGLETKKKYSNKGIDDLSSAVLEVLTGDSGPFSAKSGWVVSDNPDLPNSPAWKENRKIQEQSKLMQESNQKFHAEYNQKKQMLYVGAAVILLILLLRKS